MADWLNPNEWGRAFCRHFCLATFRDEIPRETEIYRRQLETVAQGAKTAEEILNRVHELETEEIKKRAERDIADSGARAKYWEDNYHQVRKWFLNASAYIALAEARPLEWALGAHTLDPEVRNIVDKFKSHLPPPLPPPPTLQGLGLGTLLATGAPKTLKEALTPPIFPKKS